MVRLLEERQWRAEVLAFLRDYLEPAETYRLGPADLAFGELLPRQPSSVEQAEYEERTRVGFQLERLTRTVGELAAASVFAAPGPERAGDRR